MNLKNVNLSIGNIFDLKKYLIFIIIFINKKTNGVNYTNRKFISFWNSINYEEENNFWVFDTVRLSEYVSNFNL